MLGKVNVAYRFFFTVRLGTGAPATGVAGGSFTVTVRNPGNTATMAAPTITEVSGGMYYFDISATFSNTHGAGQYGVTIEINSGTPAVRDTQGDVVDFFAVLFDDVPTAAGISTQVWTEPLPGAFGAGSAGFILGTNLDVLVSSRATQAQILSDATPFAGANIDAAISSRAAPGDAMALTAGAVDDIWDENIVSAHGTASSAGLLLRVLGAAISTRANNPTLDALLGVPDVAANDVASEVDAVLTAAHGAGSWQSATPPSAATIATAVWNEALPGAFGAGTAGNIVGNNLDAAVSTRATQAQILSDATPFAGANIDAAISTRATQAQILSDATPFPGANIDAAISSRAVPGDAMALTAAAVDDIWDENIVAAHGGASSAGLLLRVLGAAISTRANTPTLNGLLGVADSAGVDLPEQINTELEVTQGHGAGSWQSATVSPSAVATAVWSEALPGAFGAGTAGNIVGNNLDAAVSTRATQAQILSDATPFAGANIDAAISSRSSHTPANVDTTLSGTHGAGSWQGTTPSAVSTAVWQEALPGAFLAGSAGFILGTNVDALISSRATQAQILSDATPFPGANIDAAISSRSTPAQITAAQAAIIAELARLIIAVEDTAIAGSSPTEIRTNLTEADDFYNNMQVVVINAAGVAVRNIDDYALTNGAITVTALPFTPAVADPVIILARTGSVPVDVAAIAAGVWSEALPGAYAAGEAGERLATTDDRVDQALSTTESNIRGADSDDLKDLSDEIAAVQSDTNDIQTRLPAALVGGAMDSDVSNIQAAALAQINTQLEVTSGHGAGLWTSAASSSDWSAAEREQIRSALGIDGTKTAAVNGQLQQFHIAATATVAAGGSAIEVRTDLTQADDFWNNMVMIVEDVGGTGERVARNIDDYTNTNGALYVFGGLPFTPAAGDRVYIVARTGSLRDDNGPIGCL